MLMLSGMYLTRMKRPLVRSDYNPLIRLGIATFYWFVLTQSLVITHSILDHILMATGECQRMDDATGQLLVLNVADVPSCRKQGGAWNGFDISGHSL